MFNITNESAEDKLQQYEEFNNDIDAPTGYVDYIPNELPKVKSSDTPKVDISTLSPSTYKPIIYQTPKVKEEIKPVEPETVGQKLVGKANPIAATASTPVLKLPPNTAARQAYSYLMQTHKIAPHVAAGIVGNLYQESGLDPTAHQKGGGPGRGIAQWTEGQRWRGLQKWAKDKGVNPLDLHTQLDFILNEPGQEKAIAKTLAAKNVDEATMIFGKLFEAPNEAAANWIGRKGVANYLLTGK